MNSNSRVATVDIHSNNQNPAHLLIPEGAIVTGGLVGVQTNQQSVILNLSIGGSLLLNQQTLLNDIGLMVPLNSGVIQSINNLAANQWPNDSRDWKQVPISLDSTGPTQIIIYGINYQQNHGGLMGNIYLLIMSELERFPKRLKMTWR